MAEYLGLGDHGTCESCGEVIRLLPHHCPGHRAPIDDVIDSLPFEPYDVTCARCGKALSCVDAYLEEGDEWECPPCWERCEAQQRAAGGDPA